MTHTVQVLQARISGFEVRLEGVARDELPGEAKITFGVKFKDDWFQMLLRPEDARMLGGVLEAMANGAAAAAQAAEHAREQSKKRSGA